MQDFINECREKNWVPHMYALEMENEYNFAKSRRQQIDKILEPLYKEEFDDDEYVYSRFAGLRDMNQDFASYMSDVLNNTEGRKAKSKFFTELEKLATMIFECEKAYYKYQAYAIGLRDSVDRMSYQYWEND